MQPPHKPMLPPVPPRPRWGTPLQVAYLAILCGAVGLGTGLLMGRILWGP
jgi:hypothetical protein